MLMKSCRIINQDIVTVDQLTNRCHAEIMVVPGNSSQSLKAMDLLCKGENVDLNIDTIRAVFLPHLKISTAEPT